ncbi:MAG TPA: hypothetical protein VD997_02195 [Phycisphaerales bacterium]|nr:hypothetical protein [Phycisphaerales bacterium]
MNDSNLDILITRVLDQRASAADWVELEALAARDASVWRELAMAHKQEAALSSAVREAAGRSSSIELPAGEGASPALVHPAVAQHAEAGVRSRVRLVATWSGWAAAALVALAFTTGQIGPRTTPTSTQVASPTLGLPDMLNSYLEQGKKEGVVVGELPEKVVLDTVKQPDGRTEIVFVRQIVERAQVNDLYKPTTDEAGNPTMVKVQIKVNGRKSAM